MLRAESSLDTCLLISSRADCFSGLGFRAKANRIDYTHGDGRSLSVRAKDSAFQKDLPDVPGIL